MLYRLSIYTRFCNLIKGGETMRKEGHYKDDEDSDDDINIYSKSVRESMLDDDELSAREEAFLSGYEDAL